MPKKKIFGDIKVAVLIGYLFLFALSIYGLVNIYRQLVEFSESTIPTKIESKELNLVSNALVTMYEIESARKVMFSEQSSIVKEDLLKSNKKLRTYIDSLYNESDDLLMQNRLDTIKNLLDRKDENLAVMYEMVETMNNLPKSKIISTSVFSKQEVVNLKDLINRQILTLKDTVYFVKEKRSFGQRLKALFNDDADSVKVVNKQELEVDTTNKVMPTKMLMDSIVRYVSGVNSKNDKRKINYLVKLSVRQNQILYYDELLTYQINSILKSIEANEKERFHNNLLKREEILTYSYHWVSNIGLIALFVVLIFIFWSLVLINRNTKNQKELEKSNQYAERLLKSRERLLLMMSHDVKAPLSSILGHIELMSDSKLSEKDKKNLDNMRYSSEQILELSKKLMDFHQLEKGKSEVQVLPFSPYELINNVAKSYIPTTEKKHLYLNIENNIPKQLVCIADPQIIKQILNNLISNAVKFTNRGGIVVKATLNEGKDNMFITVKDTGVGISDVDKDSIFQDFSKADNNSQLSTIDIPGHGLGLAITERLIKLIGGTIQFDSKVDVGTEFNLSIPLEVSKTNEVASATKEKKVDKTVPSILKNVKVLIVDDDVTILQVYSSLAAKYKIFLKTFSNSLEVIEHLKKEQYDIIFTDIQMPGMNGFELVRKIRELDGKIATTTIIALSARFDMKEEEYIEAGFDNFLIKPVSFDKVQEVMIKALKKSKGRANNMNFVEENLTSISIGFENLITFVKDDKDTALDILNTFKQENEIKITEMEQGMADDDWDIIKSNAHKLLPLMRMINDEKIVTLLEELEVGTQSKTKVEQLISLLKNKNIQLEKYIMNNF